MHESSQFPLPTNEPVRSYAPGTPERAELKQVLEDLSGRVRGLPLVIAGKEVRTGRTVDVVMPHCHRHVLARVHQARPEDVRAAVAAALLAQREWSTWTLEQRAR